MKQLTYIDLGIVIGYNVAVLALGCWFFRRSRSSERFITAGRSLPGWAVGLSIFGSYVSSISFLANPGKAFAANWNLFVFAFAMPLAALIAVRWFVPWFRQSGEVSAYEHLERRFGPWARSYAVVCFLLVQVARLAAILYLLALALHPMVGGEVWVIIVLAGLLVTIYPFLGGTEGMVWVGVVQSLMLLAGTIACLVTLMVRMPGGVSQIVQIAAAENKFSMGSFGTSLSDSTFWVVLLYGFVTHLQNFGIDQSYVQRYFTARTDHDASWSVWLATLFFIPVSAAFFFIGTGLFAFYQVLPERLPAALKLMPDAVFPHFINTELPVGLTGLVIAAICAASMDANLNYCATLFLCDVYKRYLKPQASERESVWVLRLATLGIGLVSTLGALTMLLLLHGRTTLDVYWRLVGILSGGILGLFLLGLMSRRAGSRSAMAGVTVGIITICWLTFSPIWTTLPVWARSPFNSLLTLVIGTAVVLGVGLVAALGGRFGNSSNEKKGNN
jgi:SSS family solute:Na+ symporter